MGLMKKGKKVKPFADNDFGISNVKKQPDIPVQDPEVKKHLKQAGFRGF